MQYGPGMETNFGVEAVGQYKNMSYFNEARTNTSTGASRWPVSPEQINMRKMLLITRVFAGSGI